MGGNVDLLVSLESAEALRYAHYLKPGALAVVSTQRIVPVTVSSGKATYPADVDERLARAFPRLVSIDAIGIAHGLGNAKAANVVALGRGPRAALARGQMGRGYRRLRGRTAPRVEPARVPRG
jgi:Pyruvate/2-oxoacid:ferredoxin oxidoreductase gamma subunit